MPKIFTKNISDTKYHPDVCEKLDRLQASPNCDDQALLENLTIDDRVPKARYEQFLDYSCSTTKPLTDDLLVYSKKEASGFVGLNDPSNIVYELGAPCSPELPGEVELVTVQSLYPDWGTSLHNWILENLYAPENISLSDLDELEVTGEFNERLKEIYDRTSKEQAISDWLSLANGRRGSVPSLLRKSLFDSYIKLLSEDSNGAKSLPDRLTWVGRWSEFESIAHMGAMAWLEVFGLGHHAYFPRRPNEETWFIVLKYRILDCQKLLRPTVLDAGGNPWHYPNPGFPAVQGGKTVVFGNSLDSGTRPLSEFIHPAIRFKPTNIWAIDSLSESDFPQSSYNVELARARSVHRTRIVHDV